MLTCVENITKKLKSKNKFVERALKSKISFITMRKFLEKIPYGLLEERNFNAFIVKNLRLALSDSIIDASACGEVKTE